VQGGAAKAFKFEAAWLQEETSRHVVEGAWGDGGDMGSGLEEELRGVATSLEDWSTNVLGDLEKRLRKAKELERLRREPISDLAVGREAVCSFKVDRLEEQIDTY